MLIKKCPWCENKISPYQLGKRLSAVKPKWYQFTVYLQVCPYCNNPVKLAGKGIYGLILVLPVFLALPLEAIIGKSNFNANDFKYVSFGLGTIGILIFLLTTVYQKDNRS